MGKSDIRRYLLRGIKKKRMNIKRINNFEAKIITKVFTVVILKKQKKLIIKTVYPTVKKNNKYAKELTHSLGQYFPERIAG